MRVWGEWFEPGNCRFWSGKADPPMRWKWGHIYTLDGGPISCRGNYAESMEFYTQAQDAEQKIQDANGVRRAEANFMLNEIQLATEDCNTAVFIDPNGWERLITVSSSLSNWVMANFRKPSVIWLMPESDSRHFRSEDTERVNRVMDEIKKEGITTSIDKSLKSNYAEPKSLRFFSQSYFMCQDSPLPQSLVFRASNFFF